jgi:hypothetical protein
MITKEILNNELFVFIIKNGKKEILYKRWLDRNYGIVMCKQPFTAKDVCSINNEKNLK